MVTEPDQEIRFRYYQPRPGVKTDYSKRTPDDLVRDVNVLHDFTKNLVREKNSMQVELTETKTSLKFANLKIWILVGVVSAEGLVLGWLVPFLLDRIK